MSLNLYIEYMKPGVEVTTVKPDGKVETGWVRTIHSWDEKYQRWFLAGPEDLTKISQAFLPDCKGYNFMQRRNTDPSFFYTANPEHVAQAKKNWEKLQRKKKKEEKERNRRLDLAMPIAIEMIHEDDDPSCFANTLCNLLTDQQIQTLKGWLNL